jgi:hypothetical protein
LRTHSGELVQEIAPRGERHTASAAGVVRAGSCRRGAIVELGEEELAGCRGVQVDRRPIQSTSGSAGRLPARRAVASREERRSRLVFPLVVDGGSGLRLRRYT